MQDRGVPSEQWNVSALFVENSFISFINVEMFVKGQQINLRCTLEGCQPFQKKLKIHMMINSLGYLCSFEHK